MEDNNVLQQYLNTLLMVQRQEQMRTSIQLTLGQLIEQLEKAGTINDETGKPKGVVFDFGNTYPTTLDSWRGSYAELALGYSELWPNDTKVNAVQLLEDCKQAIGRTYKGYKGGHFKMNKNTPIWVANYGHSSNTGIVGVMDCRYRLIILTAYMEY